MKLTLEKGFYGFAPVTDDGRKYCGYFKQGDTIEVTIADGNPGSWPMLKTWMKWMQETAAHMAAQGCTMPLYIDSKGVHHGKRGFEQRDAHDLFTSTYLGTDEHGNRKTWSMTDKPGEVQASKGDRLHCMDQHLAWCVERGIKLTVPDKSEYMKLKREAEGMNAA